MDGLKFKALAASNHVTSSSFLRQIILMVIGSKKRDSLIRPNPEKNDLVKITVRIPRFLHEGIKQRSDEKSMSINQWIAALLQSNLMMQPVTTQIELAGLKESNRELFHIGHNINQIAKALNENFHETDRVNLATLKTLEAAIEQNRETIQALVRASHQSWKAENELD